VLSEISQSRPPWGRDHRNLGGEYVKTKGHHHPENPAGTGYPELYEVLDGTAHFQLQTKALDDVVLIEVHKGDIIAIPPGYGHVTINPSPGQTLTFVQSGFNRIFQRVRFL
jgi:glucose-6-phosphate isomerase